MDLQLLAGAFVALIALINPIQKIFVVTSLQEQFSGKDLRYLSFKASLTALIILLFFLFLGHLIFNYVFHIQLYAFQVTCGVVLFYNGINGLQKGAFLQVDRNVKLADLTAVPVAMPMIAGPATITAVVTFPAHYGKLITILAIFLALAVNLLLMIFARSIGKLFARFNLMNALIRITGLIVATIGVQMVFNGITTFIGSIHPLG
ncbi:MAG: MarC family protein [Marinilabiliales bacterium]|nr:MarC family protein [Marinilabiliales bacterium]